MVQAGAARLQVQDEELQRARKIQESLLPKEIAQLLGFEVTSAWQTARAVGGDYFDVLNLGDKHLARVSPTSPAKRSCRSADGQRAGQPARVSS